MLKINQIQFITGSNSLSANVIWNFLSVIPTPFRAKKLKYRTRNPLKAVVNRLLKSTEP